MPPWSVPSAPDLSKDAAFLAENATKPGVTVLPSGLQYKVLTQGTGRRPSVNDPCVCHYRGTLIDGTEFDSSFKRGTPSTFKPNQVIGGWTEALQLMPAGSKWALTIPNNLAYGDEAKGAHIYRGAVLCFELELIEVK